MDFKDRKPLEMGVYEFDPNNGGYGWIIGIVAGCLLSVFALGAWSFWEPSWWRQ